MSGLVDRIEPLRVLAERGATEGERAAAAKALAVHEAKLEAEGPERLLAQFEELQRGLVSPWAPEPLTPPGPDLLHRGKPFRGREHDGLVWVAVREAWVEGDAQTWIEDRRRMLVLVDGKRMAMVPTAFEIDFERQQTHVTAPLESLTEWS